MTVKSIWLRKIHKWVGLVIGLQFLLWAISGAAMALLDMETVSGGPKAKNPEPAVIESGGGWPQVQQALSGQQLSAVAVKTLPSGSAYQVTTGEGVRLFDLASGAPVAIDAAAARSVAEAAHPDGAKAAKVEAMGEKTLAVRDFELPIWRVDFADRGNSAYYVSATTGDLLARRNDTWRWWDFFWMLHNMDYSERSSFNHPLIITVGLAMAWLAITGFWLLFRTMWRHDFRWLRSKSA